MKKINFNNLHHKTKFKLLFSSLIIVFICIFLILFHFWQYPLISPLAENGVFEFLSAEKVTTQNSAAQNKIVYGYLPYWNINQTKIQPELTHLSYFGLNISADGTILTKNNEDKIHAGYNNLSSDKLMQLASEVNNSNNYFEITLVQFDPEIITKIVNNKKAHDNLIASLNSLLLAYPISGINIDIEYNGAVNSDLRNNFAELIEKINSHLTANFEHVQLSIAMYASASDNKQLWDIPRISQAVDYIVVMAYDFHRTSSPKAGPIAPLFGSNNLYDDYIHQNLHNYLRYVPANKILLGIPFYGYEWQVTSRSPRADTYPDTGRTASYQRVKKLLDDNNLKIHSGWDERALCPYLSYENDEKIYIIYYENPISIEYKLQYVKQLDLAGVAIWALGYEGITRDFWDVVAEL